MSNPDPTRHRGIFAPVLTPFYDNLEPDIEAFVAHCKLLLASDVGLAIFGTNSEASSLSFGEKIELIDALIAAGIDPARIMSGTGSCSLKETIALTRHSIDAGVTSVLMLPPFFYKNVSEDGVFAFYSAVVEAVGDRRLGVYLYHIPALSGVPVTPTLIERLRKRYPSTILGVKDSTGDWENTRTLLTLFGNDGFDVFPASEALLLDALALGGAGCISATANLNPAVLSALYRMGPGGAPNALRDAAFAVRRAFQQLPMIPAMKAVKALRTGHRGWKNVRPPLTGLSGVNVEPLVSLLEAAEETTSVPAGALPASAGR
ncbi:dihydrodipicolinate synthase family protein [Paraburkholderia unamae]|uniref:4-hydroxy-tetrahydrodipicolinate synthase n=1 Tax=Paraburkholderia unamae TaxID=219649 RepID=A0ABX5KWQ3_9BURK|nr:dihydrodipicolinate synthase family protein [Paraburkholderia unamae]PVX85930.1 4-hydroxy-tetrahydrodipicolinate synthase [Paraburkholderia unamae]